MRSACDLWPVRGPNRPTVPHHRPDRDLVRPVDQGFLVGAGEERMRLAQPKDGHEGFVDAPLLLGAHPTH